MIKIKNTFLLFFVFIQYVYTNNLDHWPLMELLKQVKDNEFNNLVFFDILISYFADKCYKNLLYC